MRIVIGEDEALLREGLVRLLSEDGLTVVATAADAAGLVAEAAGRVDALAQPRDDRLAGQLAERAVADLGHQQPRRVGADVDDRDPRHVTG